MRKSILNSSTTQSVSAAGATVGAALTAAEFLEQAFPGNQVLSNPAVTGFVSFVLTTFLLPWLSRQIARIRGK
jgi:hypothetical protein